MADRCSLLPESAEKRLADLIAKQTLLNGRVEHDEEITSIDYHCSLKLIASGDKNGLIKIWNYKRQLVREV